MQNCAINNIFCKGANSQHIFQLLHYFKSGASRRCIFPIFGYGNHVSFNAQINATIDLLASKWVSKYLGHNAWSMKDIENLHCPKFCTSVFPMARAVIDGGYYKVQKLSHHILQKKTWSLHKEYNLIKFMDVTLLDGRIYDVFGPYFADGDHNDPRIWDAAVEDNENNFKTVFKPGARDFICFDFTFIFPLFFKMIFILTSKLKMKCH